jgi:hypothetical protein
MHLLASFVVSKTYSGCSSVQAVVSCIDATKKGLMFQGWHSEACLAAYSMMCCNIAGRFECHVAPMSRSGDSTAASVAG